VSGRRGKRRSGQLSADRRGCRCSIKSGHDCRIYAGGRDCRRKRFFAPHLRGFDRRRPTILAKLHANVAEDSLKCDALIDAREARRDEPLIIYRVF
jgi:hypothetical protein